MSSDTKAGKQKKMPPELGGVMAVINGFAASQAAMMACLVHLAKDNRDNEKYLQELEQAIEAFDMAGDGLDKLNELLEKMYDVEY